MPHDPSLACYIPLVLRHPPPQHVTDASDGRDDEHPAVIDDEGNPPSSCMPFPASSIVSLCSGVSTASAYDGGDDPLVAAVQDGFASSPTASWRGVFHRWEANASLSAPSNPAVTAAVSRYDGGESGWRGGTSSGSITDAVLAGIEAARPTTDACASTEKAQDGVRTRTLCETRQGLFLPKPRPSNLFYCTVYPNKHSR